MDQIYDEMFERNLAFLKSNLVEYDPLLLKPELDTRRCIALVSDGDLHLRLNFGYGSNKSMTPTLHSTLMVLRGWNHYDLDEDFSPLHSLLEIRPYRINFQRLIPVKTGLVLVGVPDREEPDLLRQRLREAGYETDVFYRTNIYHITLLRWTGVLTRKEQDDWLSKIIDAPIADYGYLEVTGFQLTEASWTMKLGSYRIIKEFSLIK